MSLKIAVITSTTRPTRVGPGVANWFMDQVADFPDAQFDLIDIAEQDLPFLKDPESPMTGNYQEESTKQWSQKIAGYDGFVFVVAEYNHGYPAPLKNAIDTLYAEWGKKPVAFVGYGVLGGARAIEQLVQVTAQLNMVPLPSKAVNVIETWAAFDENSKINAANQKGANPKDLAETLVWWARTLKAAR